LFRKPAERRGSKESRDLEAGRAWGSKKGASKGVKRKTAMVQVGGKGGAVRPVVGKKIGRPYGPPWSARKEKKSPVEGR